MRTGYTVLDLMTTKPVSCSANISLQECAKLMRDRDVGSLLVMENEELIGIVTEEDFVYKAVAEGSPLTNKVADIMTTKLVTINPGVDIFDAVKVMNEHAIRHMPVVDSGKLVGYITLRTILKIEPQLFDILAEKIELRGIRPDSPFLNES